MNTIRLSTIALLLAATALGACATNTPSCVGPQSRNLGTAISEARNSLAGGCAAHFDRYFDTLLGTAEGDPKPENKREFSEFLVWASDQGLLSTRQAQDYYNRYFNVKFMSLRGDYNNCSHTCPNKQRVLSDMELELSDKERGLLRVSLDQEGYYRADRLYQEVELVLEATCSACAAGR
jgi:predicted small secreted protein